MTIYQILDYYLQAIEHGCGKKTSAEMTFQFMKRFRESMKREDYLIAFELVSRIDGICREV